MTIYIPFRGFYYTRYIRIYNCDYYTYWNENPRYKHFLTIKDKL